MPRLLALDLDGTLLRADGSISPRDAAAIRRVRAVGVAVTLATGRLPSGAVAAARALDLATPLICADGALLARAATGEPIEQRAIDLPIAETAVRTAFVHALAPFVLLHDGAHGDVSGRSHGGLVRGWTPKLILHPRLCDALAWRRAGEVAIVMAIGERSRVEAAAAELGQALAGRVDSSVDVFGVGGSWALRVQPSGCNKGLALAQLAARLGVNRANVAAIGDWFNDLSMFAWAGRSFAMGHAPEAVRAAATDTLEATSSTGGGVVEAVERWLAVDRGRLEGED